MKVQKTDSNAKQLSFSGHWRKLDKHGGVRESFKYPYDNKKYKCELELYDIDIRSGKAVILDQDGPAYTMPLAPEGAEIDIQADKVPSAGMKNGGFAYRFKLTELDEKTGKPKMKDGQEIVTYGFDQGSFAGMRWKKSNYELIDSMNRKNEKEKFNVVFNNRALITKNGPMEQIIFDSYYPGVKKTENGTEADTALRNNVLLPSMRTHANKLGGNFYGVIHRLPELKKEGIKRIVGTPITKDTVSSHLYWTENAFQIAPSLGNENDFKNFQKKLFAYDINLIADAALVNEGMGGIHVDAVLRRKDGSAASGMFRNSGGQKILGILPSRSSFNAEKTAKHTKMKIINAPFAIKDSKIILAAEKNKDGSPKVKYDKNKPTFIQFYDDRLASEEQIASSSPSKMKTYAKLNPEKNKIYDITKHDDAVYPFALEADPNELLANVRKALASSDIEDLNHIPYEAIDRITNFTNYKIGEKPLSGGFELWSGNVDIMKSNFFLTAADTLKQDGESSYDYDARFENMKRGSLAARDYALTSGIYWTKITSDAQIEYAASELSKNRGSEDAEGYYNAIQKLTETKNPDGSPKEPKFPESAKFIDKEIIQNVLSGRYELNSLKENRNEKFTLNEFLFKNAIETPLESLPIANNLMSILTSPYLVQRPLTDRHIGLSKYYLSKKETFEQPYIGTLEDMQDFYKKDIVPLIENITSGLEGISKNGQITDYGNYVLSEIVPDLTKYIITKSLVLGSNYTDEEAAKIFDDSKIISKDGVFDFSKADEESITMQSLNLSYRNGKDEYKSEAKEAARVITCLKNGIERISDIEIEAVKDKITERFKNLTVNDYKIAEMIHNRTEAGLGWRIDAAKDIGPMDAAGSNDADIQKVWKDVTGFWKTYVQAVHKINPHAYTTAEITDLPDYFKLNKDAEYGSPFEAEKKFIEETGITSTANYSYFFSLMPELFNRFKFESGDKSGAANKEDVSEIIKKLTKGWTYSGDDNAGFLYSAPFDSIINSYTFFGNHDKPRMLHCLSLDMNFFQHTYLQQSEIFRYNKEIEEQKKKEKPDKGRIEYLEKLMKADRDLKDRAMKVMQKTGLKDDDFEKVGFKACAMGERINEAIDVELQDNLELKKVLKKAVSNLAQGICCESRFEPDDFGARTIERAITSVFDEAEYRNKFKIENRDELERKIFRNILAPSMDKYLSMYKMLVTLPGSPTEFAGDKLGMTGYETRSKNYYQQNRNIIKWEHLNDDNYKFIQDFYKKTNEISNLRSRKELSALNDGACAAIPIIEPYKYKEKVKNKEGIEIEKTKLGYRLSKNIQAVLRYNDKGSTVISLYTNSGANVPNTKPLNRKDIETSLSKDRIYDRIVLNPGEWKNSQDGNDLYDNAKNGVRHGLKEGMEFKKFNMSGDKKVDDGTYYKIEKMPVKDKDYYCLVRRNSKTHQEVPIVIDKNSSFNTLILYNMEGEAA